MEETDLQEITRCNRRCKFSYHQN